MDNKKEQTELKATNIISLFNPKKKNAGRHFGFLKKAGRHQKGAGRRALQKRPWQNTASVSLSPPSLPASMFLSLSVSLSPCLPLCLSLSLLVPLSLSLSVSLSVSLCLSVSLSVSVSRSIPIKCLSLSIYIYGSFF